MKWKWVQSLCPRCPAPAKQKSNFISGPPACFTMLQAWLSWCLESETEVGYFEAQLFQCDARNSHESLDAWMDTSTSALRAQSV